MPNGQSGGFIMQTGDRVVVEEQYHDSYIIHFSDEPIRWLSVGSGSPLFLELRRRHAQWAAEHPAGTAGWGSDLPGPD
jgi:hypothetical protein